MSNLLLHLFLCLNLPAYEAAKFSGPWNVKELQEAKISHTWGEESNGVRQIYYPGETYKGKPTRIFAYYGKPAGSGPFPAVVLVHGGGGKAFPDWVRHWTKRGYCALAMDLAGNGPNGRLDDGGPNQSDKEKFLEFTGDNIRDMWTYHAVSAVIRGHSLIAGFPEVDRNRTAVTGISWGGYLTCIVAGLDSRFKAAVPVYGCGFLHENSAWKESHLDKMPEDKRTKWVANFDPSKYLPGASCPILFINGTNDFAYPLDSYKKCYNLVRENKTICIKVRMPHGHIWTFGEVDAFIDSHINSGKQLLKLGELQIKDGKTRASVDSPASVQKAMLHYAINEGPWQKREWKSIDANIQGNEILATLPEMKNLVFYISIIDDRKLEVSSRHLIQP